MKKLFMRTIALPAAILALLLAGQAAAAALTVTSPAFADGGRIPPRYALENPGGAYNISIPLNWTAGPAGTQSFAFSMVDHHPVANNWVHWLVTDLPAGVTSLLEGSSNSNMPAGSHELNNSWGWPYYGGPYPPAGTGLHPYVVTVYALNVATLGLPANTSLDTFQAAIADKTLAAGSITGYYRVGESSAADNFLLND